jgi:hypothetical protein
MKNVLILGCARSGTSILGEYFEHFPGYHYLFEPTLEPEKYAAAFANSGRPLAVKRPKVAHEAASTFTRGLAFNWPALAEAFPGPYLVIWIVRHPFDTICSLRPGILSDWNHSPRPHNWRELRSQPWEIQCAAHWANINGPGFDAVRSVAKIIRYEDLVTDPQQTAELLGEWIGWSGPCPESVNTWVSSVGNQKGGHSYEAKMQTRWSENNHHTRVGRHIENLNDVQRAALVPTVEAAAANFQYDLAKI